MKEPILKAVAMPPRLFWAPALPAAINLGLQFCFLIICLGLTSINPLWFVISIVSVHIVIVILGVKEPHLSNMTKSRGYKIPFRCKTIYRHKGSRFAS